MRVLFLSFLLLCCATDASAAQPSQRDRAIAITAELQAHGQRYEGRHITLWVERDRLDEAGARAFLAQLDRGVEVIRDYLGRHVDEPVSPRRLEMYLSPKEGIAHVRGDIPTMIYVPVRRVREGTAPYLHEIVHALASWSWRHSEWLGEGLANHVAQAVEARSGGYHHSVVLPDRLEGIARHLASPEGVEMLALVGPRGRRSNYPPALDALFRKMMANRPAYAPAFYAQSWSFVDFLVERHGLDGLRAHAAAPAGTLDIPRLKREWIKTLGTTPS